MSQKNILLLGTRGFGILQEIKKNLLANEYSVEIILAGYEFNSCKLKSLKYFLNKVCIKLFYKNDLQRKTANRFYGQNPKANKKLKKYDYVIIIRGDMIPLNYVKQLKEKGNSIYIYHWDSLKRHPEIHKYIPYANRFYVFDPKDANSEKIGITNFFFDYEMPNEHDAKHCKTAYYIGNFVDVKRVGLLEKIAKILSDEEYDINFQINKNKDQNFDLKFSKYIYKTIDYDKNIENVLQSDILIDIHNPIHKGLSFRFFEAIKYGKKIITDNPEVENYDFYNSQNIFIIRENNLDEIVEFVSTPFIGYSQEIIAKYSFSNWFNNIVQLSCIPIEIPNLSEELTKSDS